MNEKDQGPEYGPNFEIRRAFQATMLAEAIDELSRSPLDPNRESTTQRSKNEAGESVRHQWTHASLTSHDTDERLGSEIELFSHRRNDAIQESMIDHGSLIYIVRYGEYAPAQETYGRKATTNEKALSEIEVIDRDLQESREPDSQEIVNLTEILENAQDEAYQKASVSRKLASLAFSATHRLWDA